MPLYQFKCVCGLIFERLVSFENKELKCPACSGLAHIVPINRINAQVEGGTPAESVDKAVGRDAEKRWVDYGDRFNEKKNIREETGVVGTSLVRGDKGKPAYAPATNIETRKELVQTLMQTELIKDL